MLNQPASTQFLKKEEIQEPNEEQKAEKKKKIN